MAFPNEKQKQVIDHRGPPLVVIAGPGTGKTATLVERMAEILDERPLATVSLLTFTRTGRKDTWGKLKKRLGEDLQDESDMGLPRVSTLHSFAKSLVCSRASAIGRSGTFSVLVPSRERMLVAAEAADDAGVVLDSAEAADLIDYCRSVGEFPETAGLEPGECELLLACFDALLRFYGTFDMQGLVSTACEILEDDSVSVPPLFLHVDEYQDLNPVDQRFVRLAASHPNSEVAVVGDDAQSIYTIMRQANRMGLIELADSDDWECVCFDECHRLPPHILLAAQDLLAGEGYRGTSLRPASAPAKKIPVYMCTKEEYQAKAIAALIRHFIGNRSTRRGETPSLSDFMILCPGNNFADRAAQILEEEGILTKRPSVAGVIPDDHWRLLLVLRILASKDDLALRQWLPEAGLETRRIRELRREAMRGKKGLFTLCRDLENEQIRSLYDLVDGCAGLDGDLDAVLNRLNEAKQLVPTSELFPEIWETLEEARQCSHSLGGAIAYIYRKFGLMDDETEVTEDDRVLVTTLHRAKGLEAEFVFIAWAGDRFLPSPRMSRTRDSLDEALRLLYVGMTRAGQELVFTYTNRHVPGRGRLREQGASPFLERINGHLDFKSFSKETLEAVRSS
ncbi:MAG: ATP-dependent helicase [Candidatus Eisenbacteria bacterium]